MSRILKQTIFALAAMLLWATGCPAQTEIRIGTIGHSLPFLQLDVAEAKGWLHHDKLRAKILTFKAGKDCATALLNGELEAAVIAADYVIADQGRNLKQLMVLNRVPGWILVVDKKYSGVINSPSALRGRNLGVTAPGSGTDILLTYLLSKQGVARHEFTPVRAGIETFPEIMRQGGIDGGMAVEPYGTMMVDRGDAFILVDFRSPSDTQKYLGSLYTGTCLLVRRDVIERKREAVQQLTNALVWANKWLQTASAEEVQAVLPVEYTPESKLWKKSFDNYREVFSPDGANDIERLNAVIASQIMFGTLSAQEKINVHAETLIDDSFWRIANGIPVPEVSAVPRSTLVAGALAGKIVLWLSLLLIFIAAAILARRLAAAKAG